MFVYQLYYYCILIVLLFINTNNMENVNFTAIDFETAKSNKCACQLGIVVVRKGIIVEEKCFLIQPPENKYNRHTIKVHGIHPKDTANAPTFNDIWPEIKPYLQRQVVVSHNSSFDIGVIRHDCEYYGITPCKMLSFECTYVLHDLRSLEDSCALYGIELSNHHNALDDARACANVFLEYLKTEGEWIVEREDKEYIVMRSTGTLYNEIDDSSSKTIFNPSILEGHTTISSDLLVKDLENADPDSPFYDKKLVITGVFSIDREELAIIARKMGADINRSISSKTEIVLVGYDAGPKKLEKIVELQNKGFDIKTYNNDETMNLIKKYK